MSPMSASRPSVYTSLGGRAAVERAVSIFYDRVSEDKRISKFFIAADMRRLRLKLVSPERAPLRLLGG